MKKTILAIAAVMLATIPAHAETAFDGAYIGGDFTYNSTESDVPKTDNESLEGGAFVGYGMTFDKVYVGAEADVTLGGFDHHKQDVKTEAKWSVGGTAKLGYVVTPKILTYGLVGYDYADGKIDDKSKGFGGLKYGAGAETFVRENVTVRGEVTRTDWDAKGRDVTDTKASVGLSYRF